MKRRAFITPSAARRRGGHSPPARSSRRCLLWASCTMDQRTALHTSRKLSAEFLRIPDPAVRQVRDDAGNVVANLAYARIQVAGRLRPQPAARGV
jgi:hypothetical protein